MCYVSNDYRAEQEQELQKALGDLEADFKAKKIRAFEKLVSTPSSLLYINQKITAFCCTGTKVWEAAGSVGSPVREGVGTSAQECWQLVWHSCATGADTPTMTNLFLSLAPGSSPVCSHCQACWTGALAQRVLRSEIVMFPWETQMCQLAACLCFLRSRAADHPPHNLPPIKSFHRRGSLWCHKMHISTDSSAAVTSLHCVYFNSVTYVVTLVVVSVN